MVKVVFGDRVDILNDFLYYMEEVPACNRVLCAIYPT